MLLAATVAVALAAAPVVPIAAGASGSASTSVPAGWHVVHAEGLSVQAPASWPVIDFRRHSSGCVRTDRHAVYIGAPTTSTCPAHLIGATTSVQILAARPAPSEPASTNSHGLTVYGGRGIDPTMTVVARTGSAEVIVTRGARPGPAHRIAASVQEIHPVAAPRGTRTAATAAPPAAGPAIRPQTVTATGEGFDACAAPSISALTAWGASPYRSVNIYIGGVERACAQPNLTAAWVGTVTGMGWSLIPTYVGPQAPCTTFSQRVHAATAAAQGTESADDAIAELTALGIGPGSPVYFDMENYAKKSACEQTVETFFDAWTVELHAQGYVSGIYSSAGSGITDLVKETANPLFHEPDDLWFADWDLVDSVDGDSYVDDSLWPDHQRIHQYRGGHNEKYGGVTINIDNDAVDGAVVGSAPAGDVTSPASGSTVNPGQTITVAGTFTDPIAVTDVDFAVVANGVSTPIASVTSGVGGVFSATWQVAALAGTTLTFTATVRDAAGNAAAATPATNIRVVYPGSPPTVTMAPFDAAATTSSTVTARWSGFGHSASVTDYDVRSRLIGWDGDAGPWTTSTLDAAHASLPVVPGDEICVKARAHDSYGRLGAWSSVQCIARVLDDRALTASSAWSRAGGGGNYFHTVTATTASGATLRLRHVSARQIGVLVTKCPTCGQLAVDVAGQQVGTIGLHAAEVRRQVLVMLPAFARRTGAVVLRTLAAAKLVKVDGVAISSR